RRRREWADEGIRLRIARRHPTDAQRDHAGAAQDGTFSPSDRLAVAAQPLYVLLRQRRAAGRPRPERQRSERRTDGPGGTRRGTQGNVWHLAAPANAEQKHKGPAANDACVDASRPAGGRVLRPFSRRSNVSL